MDKKAYVQEYIDRAGRAQKEFETYPQERVDEAVRAIGKKIYDEAEPLAQLAVDETKMGRFEDKVSKNKGKTKATWAKLKGVKSRNIIRYIPEEGLVEVAKPIGVIGCVCPTTNPTMTPIHNAMVALKGGNAVIVSPHPNAPRTGAETVRLIREALKEVGAPEDLVQIIEDSDLEISGLLMSMCDTCISTGGPFMVKAAFSSGKPAFGVGAGNVQDLIDRDVDVKKAAALAFKGRTYDNGVLCTCDQSLICPEEKYEEMIEALKELGVYYIDDPADIDRLRKYMFPNGSFNKDIVGKSAVFIGKNAGLDIPEDASMISVAVEKCGADEYLSKEKLCPVQCAYKYDTWEDAVKIAEANLWNDGTGHSTVIHSNNKEHIEYAAEILPVSRFSINQQGSSSLGGSLNNGLNPTATLGCGTWGNNSISENLWWNHLVNISRIAYVIPDKTVPTDEEIWAD